MKKILIIHTGGTISMKEDEKTGAVRPHETNPLHDTTPSLKNLGDIQVEELFHLPSPHITPVEMLVLRNKIEEKVAKEQIEGIVITHGTDTLEETAYFLDLTVQANVPIVVTGAMRSSNEIGADGLYNLISSVKVAGSDEACGKGVLVVLNDEIHTAKNVTKTHTSNIATFQSPQYGPIGIVTKRGVFFHHAPTKRTTYPIQQITKNVILLKAYAGMDESVFQAIQTLPLDGVVIEALGQGNLPPRAATGVRSLLEANIPVVLVSRCFNGIVQDIYGYEGGGKQLKEMGVIFSNGLSGQKARIKLLVALELTNDPQQLQEMFME
ncbi:asparaginase [Thermaerobacillus caldiproteolyticus]|uniref:asparaginase n=1 Tax=Thermaerobacillus caldiproteolyticus TaxID=247480 RepID=A0A7V9Z6L5_9BACL|nr:asparaginase [Anoxybacillus caldiproteolyticus]MBA2875000.1 L-asparaginase [Anoxybacillus caldiproteolyticus]QPA33014.1 asparaginase [Anoxybacillus caldiproteolyticus]